MLVNELHATELKSPIQQIRARVEIHKGSTLEKICNCGEELSDFTIERIGENKFFGFGICQKLKTNFLDESAALGLTKDNFLEVAFGVDTDFLYAFPKFYIEEISRDEETNDLTVVAYDGLYRAANHRVSELTLASAYTLEEFATACAALLGFPFKIENVNDNSFKTLFPDGANFSGDETIRSALDAIAEATQTIYYINNNWELTFKRLDKSGDSVYTINRNNYFEFYSRGNRVLGKVIHYTELGDNVESNEPSAAIEGATQYIRNNPFWSLREDIGIIVDNAQNAIGGISIEQFECNWFGNYLLEIGDKLTIVGKENKTFTTFLLNDSITFDGAIDETTEWEYEENDTETETNPTSLGDALNQTFARVDKINKQISLQVSSEMRDAISNLTIEQNKIRSSVEEKANKTEIEQTTNDISLRVTSIEDDGVKKVDTGTGFTFDNTGLTITQTGSETSTNIDANGMSIYIGEIKKEKVKAEDGTEKEIIVNTPILQVESEGVKSENLHAKKYLWIGSHSRFEDYEGGRTGCFWIGK